MFNGADNIADSTEQQRAAFSLLITGHSLTADGGYELH